MTRLCMFLPGTWQDLAWSYMTICWSMSYNALICTMHSHLPLMRTVQMPKYLVTIAIVTQHNLQTDPFNKIYYVSCSLLLLWCLELLPSHTNSHRCTGIPHSHNIAGSHRHCILLDLGASDSECMLTWTATALWSWVSWHRNWRPIVREDVLSWWAVNPICYGHWRLRRNTDR